MIHFQSPEATKTEFVSVCDKTHEVGELTRKWYQVSEGETQPHNDCDLCEFDEGRQQSRLHHFYSHGLLKKKDKSTQAL